jgi:hypothetical protein
MVRVSRSRHRRHEPRREAFHLTGSAAITIRILDPGKGIDTRTIYIYDCKKDGVAASCPSTLTVSFMTYKGNQQ